MKMFKVMHTDDTPDFCPTEIPFEAIAHLEEEVKRNYSQTLDRLSERGGLTFIELFMLMNNHKIIFLKAMPSEIDSYHWVVATIRAKGFVYEKDSPWHR